MRRLLALLLALLALSHAEKMCSEALITEAMAQYKDPACVADMKSCLQVGTCEGAGITAARMCECFRQVNLPAEGSGRALADYECLPTHGAIRTLRDEWTACNSLKDEF